MAIAIFSELGKFRIFVCDAVAFGRNQSAQHLALMNLLKTLCLSVASLFCGVSILAGAPLNTLSYTFFDNLSSKTSSQEVRCIYQDDTGLIWYGTLTGLYSFDGYDVRHYVSMEMATHLTVNDIYIHGNTVFLGCEDGLVLYDKAQDSFERVHGFDGTIVRSFMERNGSCWIGTSEGVFLYRFEDASVTPLTFLNTDKELSVYSLCQTDAQGVIFIGGLNGFGYYDVRSGAYTAVDDMFSMTEDICYDKAQGKVWAGSGGNLYCINPVTMEAHVESTFNNVKALCCDADGDLLVATDTGIFLRQRDGTSRPIRHQPGDDNSIAGDIAFCFFRDKDDNVWVGTGNGLSLAVRRRDFETLPLSRLTGIDEGNQISCLLAASDGTLWIGGLPGLIRISLGPDGSVQSCWFRMENTAPAEQIAHNRIRDIYEDASGRILVATDRGICVYDAAGRFSNYHIRRASAWTYDIAGHPNGDLWIASYSGLYSVGSSLPTDGNALTARDSFTDEEDLLNPGLLSIAIDRDGNVWGITRGHDLRYFDLHTHIATTEDISQHVRAHDAEKLICDSDGRIWVGAGNMLLVISSENRVRKYDAITLNGQPTTDLYAMSQVEDNIWVSSSRGLYIISCKDFKIRHVDMGEAVTAITYDRFSDKVIMGATDRVILSSSNPGYHVVGKIRITGILSGNEDLPGFVAGATNQITLPYYKNNLAITFSDCSFLSTVKDGFSFRLDGNGSHWIDLGPGNNRINLTDIKPGRHNLFLSLTEDPDRSAAAPLLSIRIRPPWYASAIAKLLYVLFICVLIYLIISYFRTRNRLRFEILQRESLLEQSNSKLDFLTNLTHDLKTPLSLITAPVGKLLSESRDRGQKELLGIVHDNAMKLSSLINKTVELNRGDSDSSRIFIPSEIEIVGFLKAIFANFSESMAQRKMDMSFTSDRERLYVTVDEYKMESIIENLLSNACKYTPDGGKIDLDVSYVDNLLKIRVVDDGIGIPEKEQGYIFQRFYQSSRTSGGHYESTGVGLAIVKDYVEAHNGTVSVESIPHHTVFTVTIPAREETIDLPAETETKEDKPLILIVEDNSATARFIQRALKDEYNSLIAGNGRDGLALCKEQTPDLVIADNMMPVMSGLEMAREIRSCGPVAGTPIILLTAEDSDQVRLSSEKADIDSFLSKPFDLDILKENVRRLISRRDRMRKELRLNEIAQPKFKGEVSADEKFLSKVMQVIGDNLSDPDFNVDRLAQISGISTKQLYRKISQITGKSTVEYIRSIRMKKAAILFRNGRFSIAEVMYMVGFSNASYFSKCFSAEFGKTPHDFVAGLKEAGE